MRSLALVPAFNEGSRIGSTVRAILQSDAVDEVLVIDDGSADDTAMQAEAAGARVLRLDSNAGKGGALQAGLDSLAELPEVVALLDADLEESANQVALLMQPIADGTADMSIASFPRPAGKAGFGLVMGLARFGIRTLGGPLDATAPLSGQRVLNRRALEAVGPFASGYGVEVALTIRALRHGLAVVEVPTTMRHAATGRNIAGFLHRGRQFVHVTAALFRLALERRPR
ncbi:MAG: glycosyltransferase family 2 protein [Actinobacteria bacterium]|nr:glycosyltransferase family 2 protein [Actinomycetota bacterium]